MPEDPEIKTPKERLAQLEAAMAEGDTQAQPQGSQQGGTTPAQQVGLEPGKLGFWESFKRPGYGNNTGADLAKLLTQGAAGAVGGAPGGVGGMLAGAGLNFAQIAANPESMRPGSGMGNATEALLGPLLSRVNKLPFVQKAAEKLPSLTTGLLTALSGGGQAAADTYDRGGNVTNGGLAGAMLGGGLGTASGKVNAMMRNLPSARAASIDRMLGSFSDSPANSTELNRSASNLLTDLAGAPGLRDKVAKEAEGGAAASVLSGTMEKAAAKKSPTVLQQATIAAKKAAEVSKAQNTAKFLATDDINDAKDYLQFDHPARLTAAGGKLKAATETLQNLEAVPSNLKNFKWYKTRLSEYQAKQQAAQAEVDSALDVADQARQLTRRTETSARKLASQNVAADMEASATDARKAAMNAERHLAELKALESAGTSAKVEVAKSNAREGYFQGKLSEVFDSAGMNAADVTPNGWRFLAAVGDNPQSLTLNKAIKTAVGDPEYAEGLRDLLTAKDPEMLKAVRGQYLYGLFEGNRSGRGGANFPKAYEGSDLVKKIASQNPEAVNMLFGDPEAYQTIQEIAQSALNAERLARPRLGTTGTHLALTGTGTLLFAGAGHLTNDPAKAGLLLALAGGGYLALNVPRFLESFIQRPTVVGKALSAYIRTPNPHMLPSEVTNALTGIAMPIAMPGTSDTKGRVAEKRTPDFTGSITGGLQQ